MSQTERQALEDAIAGLTVADELSAMAADSREAAELLERIASAVFPPEQRDLERLTWSEHGAHKVEALDPHAKAEERLKAAEARFRSLVEQIPAVTFMAALGEGENEVYVSPHIESMLGFTQEEWLENPFLWYRQLHPDDRVLWNEEFARGCRRGGPFQAECRFLARDGNVVWVHGEARVIKDELGRPLYLQGIAFDITESKKAQAVLLDRAVQDARLEEELAIARRVQTSILPRSFEVPGLEVAARMITAEDVGGDYYDILPCADGAWIGIGDVSGHGLRAGVVMLMLQSALSALVAQAASQSPAALVTTLNRILYDNIRVRMSSDDHVTMSLLRYTDDGSVTFAGAHEFILVWRSATRTVEQVWTPGTWVGAVREVGHAMVDTSLRLEPGDVMMLYTDGVTEAMDEQNRQLGIEPVCQAIAAHANAPIEELATRVVDTVNTWMHEQHDDISLVVARYSKKKGAA